MLYVRKFIITIIIPINAQLQKPFAKRTTTNDVGKLSQFRFGIRVKGIEEGGRTGLQ